MTELVVERLAPFAAGHLPELMSWLDSESACRQWGGPWFQYPFTAESFSRDCRWQELPTFVLQGEGERMLAFGQYYNRLNHCHLGRLVVSPQYRGMGVGRQLIVNLVSHGSDALGLERCSLFVLKDNHAALALYEKMGFTKTDYPEQEQGLEACHYLVAPRQKIMDGENQDAR